MSRVRLKILVVETIDILMGFQTIISKMQSPYWGAIIPLGVIATAVYIHFYLKVNLTWPSVMICVIPFIWSLEEWYRGRKNRIKESEKEIIKMRAKDI